MENTKGMKRIRVAMCGDTMVGKSSLLRRFSTGNFTEKMVSTIAGSFHSQYVKHMGETVSLEMWDTAGSERYHSVIPAFFKSAGAVIIVYDVTAQESFQNVGFWLDLSRNNAPVEAKFFLVGNKIDLSDKQVVTHEEGNDKAGEMGCPFVETSAKTGEGIDILFSMLAMVPPNGFVETTVSGTAVIDMDRKKKGCC
jgi:small GTP-binding protein